MLQRGARAPRAGRSCQPARRCLTCPRGFGLRRRLVGKSGQAGGFELLLPPGAQRRLEESAETPVAGSGVMLLVDDPGTLPRDAATTLRGDAALTDRLLRYANSPAIGSSRAVEIVDEAVFLLGRAVLYRWLSGQLMSASAARQASRALGEDASRVRGDANPGTHFTVGLLSLIEQLLQAPLAAALAPLRLSHLVCEALLHRRCAWADRLHLLGALDDRHAERADALAQTLGVQGELVAIVEDAWRWAAQLRETTWS